MMSTVATVQSGLDSQDSTGTVVSPVTHGRVVVDKQPEKIATSNEQKRKTGKKAEAHEEVFSS